MAASPLEVLYEDNHLLVLNKRPGLPTMGVEPGRDSLIEQAKQYLKQKYDKPGNVYLGVVSRLDARASGVLVFARTSKAAARLSAQFARRAVTKTYWAVIERPLDPPAGECVDWVRKDEQRQRMVVCNAEPSRGREARLHYRLLAEVRGGFLVEVQLITGRKHQIRLQLAHRSAAILGDRKYGARAPFAAESAAGAGIALHARRLELTHPVRQDRLPFVAPVPRCWRAFGRLPSPTPEPREE